MLVDSSPSFLPNTHDPVSACLSISSVSIQRVGSCTGALVPNLPFGDGQSECDGRDEGSRRKNKSVSASVLLRPGRQKEIYLKGETSRSPPAKRAENAKHSFLPLLQQREIIVACCVVQPLPS
ncbi:hypothetical protein CesoFtcFv8_025396 [Champsocephalus esox]|uniref:Uncharacterized protein n=2 Tax=Champsocephalus TaxID=52236 RepID=A0AAN8CA18_CHAGU|nr:hypothetical protein CesoFtcFv8_025396 [Champsocephalus esox]KAK5897928.1 hypothetical protein CgunFtcFv8_015388 [Champsocephalus gunnari]